MKTNLALLAVGWALCTWVGHGRAADWPMLGRDTTRNPVSPETNAPVEWDLKSGRNIRWQAELGSVSVAEPIVAGGLVWIGTNNDSPRDKSRDARGGVLACFRESTGEFLYQYLCIVTNRRTTDFGMTGSPLVEGDQLWFVTTASEVVSLDIAPLRQARQSPRVLWRLDMREELNIHATIDIMGGKGMCSPGATHGHRIYLTTGNGQDWSRSGVPSPQAPALICLDKATGELIWEDHSSGTNILFGEFASPLVLEIGGVVQVITPQGDGWVRSFDAITGKLLWKFDINPKATRRIYDRNYFLNAPVYSQGRVYLAAGRDVEQGHGPGRLVCLDPLKRGDLSLEIEEGPGRVKPNPNTGVLWYSDEVRRTISSPAIHNGLLLAAEMEGRLHCFDALTGHPLWKHDTGAGTWGSPLVVDGKIYLGNEDGTFHIFALAREKSLLFKTEFESPTYSSPVFANGVLYIVAQPTLYAIQSGARRPESAKPPADRSR